MKRILLVDDQLDMLNVLSAILTNANFETIKANSGTAALQALNQGVFDLIVLDVAMPGMNGIELCNTIRAHPETVHTPILMLSAHGDAQTVIGSMEVGATDYLPKPIRGPELVTKICDLLADSQP